MPTYALTLSVRHASGLTTTKTRKVSAASEAEAAALCAKSTKRQTITVTSIKPLEKPKANLAVIYARYSPKPKKKGKAEESREESIQVQLERCRAYCALRGIEIGLELCEPGVSGYSTRISEREKGQELLAAVASGRYKHVIVLRLDRLSRRTSDTLATIEDWVERKVSLHLADQNGNAIDASTPEGMIFLTMLSAFSQFERAMISRRTSQAMKRLARDRKAGACKTPIGLALNADGITYSPAESEQQAIARIRELSPTHSLRQISRQLTQEGLQCRGKAWSPETIRRVIGG